MSEAPDRHTQNQYRQKATADHLVIQQYVRSVKKYKEQHGGQEGLDAWA